jgi:hypothetical protein
MFGSVKGTGTTAGEWMGGWEKMYKKMSVCFKVCIQANRFVCRRFKRRSQYVDFGDCTGE